MLPDKLPETPTKDLRTIVTELHRGEFALTGEMGKLYDSILDIVRHLPVDTSGVRDGLREANIRLAELKNTVTFMATGGFRINGKVGAVDASTYINNADGIIATLGEKLQAVDSALLPERFQSEGITLDSLQLRLSNLAEGIKVSGLQNAGIAALAAITSSPASGR